jgi:hypothetical protein
LGYCSKHPKWGPLRRKIDFETYGDQQLHGHIVERTKANVHDSIALGVGGVQFGAFGYHGPDEFCRFRFFHGHQKGAFTTYSDNIDVDVRLLQQQIHNSPLFTAQSKCERILPARKSGIHD